MKRGVTTIAIAAITSQLALSRAALADDCYDAKNRLFNRDEPALHTTSWGALELLLQSDQLRVPDDDWDSQDRITTPPATGQPGRSDQVLADDWRKAVEIALSQLDLLLKCPGDSWALKEGEAFHSQYYHVFPEANPKDALASYVKAQKISSALVSSVLDSPGGAPAPQRAQITLSQIVTAGQPGLVPALAGTFDPHGNFFARHLTGSLTALIVQPVAAGNTTAGSTSPTASEPVFSNIDASLAWSNQLTAYDYYAGLAERIAGRVERFNKLERFAINRLLSNYLFARRAWLAENKLKANATDAEKAAFAKAEEEVRRLLFLNASVIAKKAFLESTTAYYVDNYASDFVNSKPVWSIWLRGRATPNAVYTPQVPDLASAQLGASGSFSFGGSSGGTFGQFHLSGTIGYSQFPTDTFKTFGDMGDSKPTALFDAAFGFSLVIPTAGLGATRITGSGVGRFRAAENQNNKLEGSAGFSAAIEVPVSERISLLGTYTIRCTINGSSGCSQVFGFSFATVAAQNNGTPTASP